MNANFRRGGLFLLPAVVLAVIIAGLFNAPVAAFVSIIIFGFVTAIVLILLGDNRKVSPTQEE
ncbi:MAG: hypothetical protein FWC73_12625 [Defluviitaleaceae bacterium]|nr:hypothetical protein [Defluviitaleaceae bacterium]